MKFNEHIIDCLRFLVYNRDFIGSEFLTWMYYELTYKNGAMKCDKSVITLGNKLILANTGLTTTYKGDLRRSELNIADALLSGQKVTSLELVIGLEDMVWIFTLGVDLIPRQAKLPLTRMGKDYAEYVTARIGVIEHMTNIIDTKLAEYAKLRLDQPAFEAFLKRFAEDIKHDD